MTPLKKIVAVVIVLVCAGGAGMYFFSVQGGSIGAMHGPDHTGMRGLGSESQARVAPAGQKLYHDNDFYFSLFYPDILSVSKTLNGVATTITFQSTKPVAGFQIYIIPYRETKISEQRFKMDEPSGVRKNVQNGLLAGVQAVAFESTDARLGDTYEVWFIHNGFLYEVTSLKVLEPWLQQIMQTWQFDS